MNRFRDLLMRTKTSDDWRGDELPEGLSTRKKRLALPRRTSRPSQTPPFRPIYGPGQLTDPESRIMKSKGSAIRGGGFHRPVGNNGDDARMWGSPLDALSDNLGERPDRVLARDIDPSQIWGCSQIDGYVAMGREKDLARATPTQRHRCWSDDEKDENQAWARPLPGPKAHW